MYNSFEFSDLCFGQTVDVGLLIALDARAFNEFASNIDALGLRER